MNKLKAIVFLVLLIFVFSACGNGGGDMTRNGQEPETADGEQSVAPDDEDALPGTERETESAGGGNEAAVIVKSGNTVTDDERKAVLEELDREIDELLDSLNELDEAEDQDLTFE